MPLMVVRHADALSRSGWKGDDTVRGLSGKGRRQSRNLVPRLLELKPSRILSSPYLRCIDTVSPLAEAAGLSVEAEERLAEGAGRSAVDLAREVAGDNVVLCSHGDVIPDLLEALADEDGLKLGRHPKVEKGSVWVLKGEGGRFRSAKYLAPKP